jgi:hypothetical protein
MMTRSKEDLKRLARKKGCFLLLLLVVVDE